MYQTLRFLPKFPKKIQKSDWCQLECPGGVSTYPKLTMLFYFHCKVHPCFYTPLGV